ncbi:uncharacterized protein METZ01_LOCUS307058, partial [marine metagenome]
MNSLEPNVVPGSTPIIPQNLQDIDTENTPTVSETKESTKTGVSGTLYSNQLKEKALNGHATTTTANDSKYVGEFKDGKYHGQGQLCIGDQKFSHDEYVGEFSQGEFEGEGTYRWADGRKYVGAWKGGEKWTGKEYCKDRKLIGNYVEGKRRPLRKQKKRKLAPVVTVSHKKFDSDWFEK